MSEGSAGKRRPKDEELEAILQSVAEGASLRTTCEKLGLDTPSTHRWLHEDDGRSQQYARAKEQRAEHYQEQALTVGLAVALGQKVNGNKVDPAGARVLLDTIKWATARMAPKTAPVQKIDLTSRTRQMTDAEIAEEIAALEGAQAQDA